LNYPPDIWGQLKNLKCEDLISALERDGWVRDAVCKTEQIYRHRDGRKVSIHYHPGKTYGQGLLKGLLKDTGWIAVDFRRLKLIK
jgi:predicted RNA binding protein YcfA (HicA-like mRNA interferase family)